MTTITNHSEYTAAVNEAKLHDYRYFTLNAPTISDEQYDALYFAIQDYETAHPDETLADSPTQTCYSENGNGKRQVARRTACLSMKKIHDAKSMVKYLRTQQKACNLSNAVIDVEWKFDGDTVALVYLNGRLAEATYGHGKELMASDCMDHVKHVQGVPQIVTAWHDIDRVEVRGEVIINNANFDAYTGKKKAHRTTCSSFMNKKVAVAQECKLLEFHPFRVIGGDYLNHKYSMVQLQNIGFLTSGWVGQFNLGWKDEHLAYDSMEDAIEDIVCDAESKRDTLPFPTDGLVFKFNDYSVYDQIGTTDHDAKYNAAFKFRPVHKAVTTYRGYHTTIGEKTGKVTYIADYDMVVLNGIECSNANCGSEQTFMAKNLKPGCKVQVSLHGDVTPHIDGIVPQMTQIDTDGESTKSAESAENLSCGSCVSLTEEKENSVPSVCSVVEEESTKSAESAENLSCGSCVSLTEEEEDINDSEPIPYVAPEVKPVVPTPEPICAPVIPQYRAQPRREPKRHYRMVGEPRARVATATVSTPSPSRGRAGERVSPVAYVFATLAVVAFIVLCFAGLGAAVFFLPLLAGAFK